MGFFSWNTCDTGESIANNYSTRPTLTAHMITPDGRVFTENDYEGYGEFGGKDFFDLLCELNGLPVDRGAGIDLVFKDNPSGDNTPGVIYPKFVECLEDDVVAQYADLPNPESCEAQGFFYGEDEDEEDEEDEDDVWGDVKWYQRHFTMPVRWKWLNSVTYKLTKYVMFS